VVGEYVGKRRRDHHPEAEVPERPDGVLAGGPAAEVFSRDQDRGFRIARPGEHKIDGLFSALFSVYRTAPVVEQEFSESGALDALQKLFGDDLIGVHVHLVERDNDAGVLAEWLHSFNLWPSQWSAGRPRPGSILLR